MPKTEESPSKRVTFSVSFELRVLSVGWRCFLARVVGQALICAPGKTLDHPLLAQAAPAETYPVGQLALPFYNRALTLSLFQYSGEDWADSQQYCAETGENFDKTFI